MEHIAIIGNGISGITAARHIRKLSNKKITVISSETDYFFSRTALMYVYMGHMKFKHTQPYENWFWDKNDIALKKGFVKQIDASQKTLIFSDGEQLTFDKLIIATGSKPNKFGWPGQDLKGVVSLYHKQDLDAIETHDCFSITEYMAIEHFGITKPGEAWKAIEEGIIEKSGALPINPSGGLIGLGHPVGATGIRMVLDGAKQTTDNAEDMQINGAKTIATYNVGGSGTTNVSFIVSTK